MSNIEKIRQEINRLLSQLEQDPHLPDEDKEVDEAVREVLEHIKEFVNSLPHWASYDTQKFTPTPSVDIEDVARVQFASRAKVINGKRNAVLSWEQFKELAGIFHGFGNRRENGKGDSLDAPKIVSEELEEAARNYPSAIYVVSPQWSGEVRAAFKAGAEWQKEKDTRDLYMSDNRHFEKVYELGKKDMREEFEKKLPLIQKSWYEEGKIAGKYEGLKEDEKYQQGLHDGKEELMKEAEEGYVNYYEDSGGILMAEAQVGCPYHNGDKVKIIIVKEDED